MGAIIAHKRSLIAQHAGVSHLLDAFPIKFHPSNVFGRRADSFTTQSRQTKAHYQPQRGDIYD
jgi:hypothetical protein